MKVLLDTNFLVYCAKGKIDYKEDIRRIVKGKYELAVVDSVISELENLNKKAKTYRDRQAAGLALLILKANGVSVIKTEEKSADKAILDNAKDNIIATFDLRLRKNLKNLAKAVILIRGKRRVDFE